MILDTTFLVDLLRGTGGVESAVRSLDPDEERLVTTISVMELWEGICESDRSEEERRVVVGLLDSLRVEPFGTVHGEVAGLVAADLSKGGRPIDREDVMIAAVALDRDEPVLTANVGDFERVAPLDVRSY